ncbi:MAG: hypothetical protein JWN79_86 [Gemmatimonadetes bacterium]|jgi:hypothetical protein|nr:hypothetical protein [Gemmatimonadota bacterium]
MQCIRVHRARRTLHCAAALIALGGAARKAGAQSYPTYPTYPPAPTMPYPGYPTTPTIPAGVPATLPTPVLPTYRPPVIALAQPAEGVVLPEDKPVVVLRFAAVEPLDPIDALTLSVTVDGTDRTTLFTLAQGEAWGRLSPPDELLAAGQHEVRARICSTRGTCGVAKGTVTVISSASLLQQLAGAGGSSTGVISSAGTRTTTSRGARVFGAVLQAVRVLIK